MLNVIYEEDLLGFSYGFRSGRGQHDAMDALMVGIRSKKVSWILDADIENSFDTVNQQRLMRFVEHRSAETRDGATIAAIGSTFLRSPGNSNPVQ